MLDVLASEYQRPKAFISVVLSKGHRVEFRVPSREEVKQLANESRVMAEMVHRGDTPYGEFRGLGVEMAAQAYFLSELCAGMYKPDGDGEVAAEVGAFSDWLRLARDVWQVVEALYNGFQAQFDTQVVALDSAAIEAAKKKSAATVTSSPGSIAASNISGVTPGSVT